MPEYAPAKKTKPNYTWICLKQHNTINFQITRYLIATNTAFIASGKAQLRKQFDILRPGTAIPHRKKIASTLLKELFDEAGSQQS